MSTTLFDAERRFDEDKKCHYLSDEVAVLHCHHYLALFCQLSDDAKLLHGDQLLREELKKAFFNSSRNTLPNTASQTNPSV